MRPDAWTFAWKGYATRLVGPGSSSFAEDEAELRRILRDTPMEGAIRMVFTREPHFFAPSASPAVCYPFLVSHAASGRIAAVCALTIMPVHWRGSAANAAYLNLLRVLPAFRGRIAVLRAGYAAMEAFKDIVCREGPCFTSIVADNTQARRLLEAGVKGLPQYMPFRAMDTLALAARRGRPNGSLSPASVADVPELASFYAVHMAKDLAPRLPEDWFRSLGTAARPDLRIEDFLLYRRGGAIAGSMALWDQRATRQAVVAGYAPALTVVRPVYNCWAAWAGRPGLPTKGRIVNAMYIAYAAFAPEAAGAVPACIGDALWLMRERGGDTALLGFPEALSLPAADFPGIRYASVLYSVHWPGERATGPPAADARPEAALL